MFCLISIGSFYRNIEKAIYMVFCYKNFGIMTGIYSSTISLIKLSPNRRLMTRIRRLRMNPNSCLITEESVLIKSFSFLMKISLVWEKIYLPTSSSQESISFCSFSFCLRLLFSMKLFSASLSVVSFPFAI